MIFNVIKLLYEMLKLLSISILANFLFIFFFNKYVNQIRILFKYILEYFNF